MTDKLQHEEDDFRLLPHVLAYDQALGTGLSPKQAWDSTLLDVVPDSRLKGLCELLDDLTVAWPRVRSDSAFTPSSEQLPARIGRFDIRRELGHGGFGIVYLAFDPKLGREIALKIPRTEVLLSRPLRQRFVREARAAAALQHPHICPVFEAAEVDGLIYIVSPYFSQGTLAELIKQQPEPMSAPQAATVVRDLADAVQYAHQRGILHRDIKPANILIESRDAPVQPGELRTFVPFTPRLTDFGLAKFLEGEAIGAGDAQLTQPVHLSATVSGTLLGTPSYMASEQIEGTAISPATDVYALGIVLYELLTGGPPFAGGSKVDVLRRVLTEEPIPIRRLRSNVPRDLEAICLRCLEKQPRQRYASAELLGRDLCRYLRGEPTLARPLTSLRRGWRWTRKRPAWTAVFLLGVLTSVLALTGFSFHLAQMQAYTVALQDALTRENQQFGEANFQRLLAEQREFEARQAAYTSEVWRTWQMWRQDEEFRMCGLLQRSRPTGQQADLRGFEWHYLWALGSNLSQLDGHQGGADEVHFSPDGKQLISCNSSLQDSSIRIWDVPQRRQLLKLAPAAPTQSVMPTADGRHLVSINQLCQLEKWDAHSGKRLAIQKIPDKTNWNTSLVKFSPDGSFLAYTVDPETENFRRVVNVMDIDSGQFHTVMRIADGHISSLAISGDNKLVAVAVENLNVQLSTLYVCDLSAHEVATTYELANGVPRDLSFSADNARIYWGEYNDSVLYELDIATGKKVIRDEQVEHTAHLVFDVSRDDKLWASSRFADVDEPLEMILKVVEMQTNRVIATPSTSAERISSIDIAPSGNAVAYLGGNGLFRLWQRDQHPAFEIIPMHSTEVWCVTWSPDGRIFATGSDDHTVKLWNAETDELLATLTGHESLVTDLAFSPDGQTLASASFDCSVILWDVQSGAAKQTFRGHTDRVDKVVFLGNGKMLASVGADRAVLLWDVGTGQVAQTLHGHTNRIHAALADPARGKLVTADNHGAVKIWDPAQGKQTRGWVDSSEVQSLAIRRDGQWLAAGSKEGTIRLYQMPEAKLVHVLSGVPYGARALAFSPDGLTLASGGEDAAVTLWQVATGQELFSLPGVKDQVNSLSFAPDGRSLLAATHDGNVVRWKLAAQHE